jgi:two-component system chemotaxis response regulator CheB
LVAAGADHVVAADGLVDLLEKLVSEPFEPQPLGGPPDLLAEEVDSIESDNGLDLSRLGASSGFSCPDCNGVLWEVEDGELLRFRCRVGHAWSAESLKQRKDQAVEDALFMAIRTLEERADLTRRMSARATRRGASRSARRFVERAEEAEGKARLLRQLLDSPEVPDDEMSEGAEGE